ncbi:MAG TPA: c-type cytochrome domain-containing protein [Verrucomicrobiae bacterium]|nr:c-type cytochrome domain-containing protein [Verrucomicrobiae bacterium]
MLKKTLIAAALATGLGMAYVSFAADVDVSKLPPASAKTGVTYEADIKPIFEKSCFKCHGAEKQKGKLRLDSLEATMKGGEDGKVIEAGKSAKSGLVIAVARLDADSAMPPEDKGKPLTAEQVGLIRAWIDQGAK